MPRNSGLSRILLVEDDDEVRRSLQLLLGSYGYPVIAHASGTGLAQNANALQADCLIADLVMPETGAFELLAEMHAAHWTGRSILITGYPVEDWRERAREVGFDAWLTKPIAASALFRTIAAVLGSLPPAER